MLLLLRFKTNKLKLTNKTSAVYQLKPERCSVFPVKDKTQLAVGGVAKSHVGFYFGGICRSQTNLHYGQLN